ncbi:unnamed protein product [Amoebophrya sp. A120]|nr:unnamed protein product [Amoebophrya sp. A120]|eukprot:GSA120T00001759001.1
MSASVTYEAMAAGWFAGLVNITIGHPFDTGKVRAQARVSDSDGGIRQLLRSPSSAGSNIGSTGSRVFAGGGPIPAGTASDRARQYAKAIRVLYRGIHGPLLTSGLSSTLMFGSWRYFKDQLSVVPAFDPANCADPLTATRQTVLIDFVAGCGSGWVNAILMFPVVCVKLRAQVTPASAVPTSFFRSVRDVLPWMRQPLTLLRLGYLPHLIQEGIGRGFYMATFTYLSGQCSRADEADGWPRPLAGAAAGIAGWTATYPCDVIRSRMQRDFHQHGQLPHQAKLQSSWIKYARQIHRKEGLSGLYRGLSFCILRAAPVACFTLPAYDMCFNLLHDMNRQ